MPNVEAVAFSAFAVLALFSLYAAKRLDDREGRLSSSPQQATSPEPEGPAEPQARDSGVPARERASMPSVPPSG